MPEIAVRDMVLERDGTLRVDGLPFRAGERVKVLVMRLSHAGASREDYPLRGVPIRYDEPFAPATDPDDCGRTDQMNEEKA